MRVPAGVWSAMALFLAGGGAAAVASAPPPSPSPVAQSGTRIPAPATAPMTSRAAKATLKSARVSMQSGRAAEALRQYESVLASTPHQEEARAEALYWAGFLRISTDPALRDLDRARAYLGELKVFHAAGGRQDEAAILLALTEEIGDAGRSVQSLRAEAAARAGETQSCRSEMEAANGQLQAALSENETLKESDSAHRAEILGLRDEVKRKDEALRKVKEVVVGWKAPR